MGCRRYLRVMPRAHSHPQLSGVEANPPPGWNNAGDEARTRATNSHISQVDRHQPPVGSQGVKVNGYSQTYSQHGRKWLYKTGRPGASRDNFEYTTGRNATIRTPPARTLNPRGDLSVQKKAMLSISAAPVLGVGPPPAATRTHRRSLKLSGRSTNTTENLGDDLGRRRGTDGAQNRGTRRTLEDTRGDDDSAD
jgi:hypothetical protein